MALQVECQGCGARYNVGENLAGKRAKCKKCGATMQIPAPAADQTDDAMSAMMELAQGEGPAPDVAPRRGRAPAANKIPAHWSADSVVVETESAPAKKRRGYGRRSGGVDPDALARFLVFLYIAATVGFAIFAHVKFGGDAPARRLGAMWGIVISNIIFYFLIAGPMTLLGAWIGAKIFREDLAGGAYARALGLAALPPFVLITLMSLAVAGVFPMDRTVPTLGLMLILPGTFLLVKVLFEFDWLKALVPWVLALIFCAIGSGTAGGLSKKVGDAIIGDDAQFVVGPAGRSGGWMSGGGRSQQTNQGTSNSGGNNAQPAPPMSETDRKREHSAQNLRRITTHARIYFGKHDRTWAPDLLTIQQTENLPEEALKSPFGPAFASSDYVYQPFVPEQMPTGEFVLAYDAAELASGEGANVAFGDGSVRWLDKGAVESALNRSKEVVAAAAQAREQEVARKAELERQRKEAMANNAASTGSPTVNASPSDLPGRRTGPGVRGGRRQDLIDKIKTSEGGVVKDVQDVAMRRGTDGFIRTSTPSPFYAVYVQDPAGETIEVYNGGDPDPKATATFQADPQHRGNYALSPDGKLLVRLTSWPKLTAVVHSFEKKQDVAKIDLLEANGRPTLVGFATPERFIVRWTQGFKHGIEVFEALKTARPKGILMPEQFQPSAGNEAISPDGRLFAVTARVPERGATTRRPPRGGPVGQEKLVLLVYELFGKPDPRRLSITGLDPDFRVQAAGIAFSPDNQRVAALFENNRKGFITSWRLRDGKVINEPVVPGEVDVPTGPNLNRQRVLDWVAGGRAWLVSGNILLNADTGAGVGRLGADNKVRGQTVTGDFTVHLPHGELSGIDGVLAVTLDSSKFPAPASASPTTPATTGTRPGTAPRTSANGAAEQ